MGGGQPSPDRGGVASGVGLMSSHGRPIWEWPSVGRLLTATRVVAWPCQTSGIHHRLITDSSNVDAFGRQVT
jgi:hypothetical protein